MAITSARVTVSTTAVALNPADTDTLAGSRLTVTNRHATDSVDLGASDVAAGAGYELKAGQTQQFALDLGDRLYAIRTGANDVIVHVLRIGV